MPMIHFCNPSRQNGKRKIQRIFRGVAQLASALGSGPRGRRFKSARPDHCKFPPEIYASADLSLVTNFMTQCEKLQQPEELFLQRWHPYIWIALAGLLVYARTLAFGFTNLDDNALITNNYPFLSNASNIIRAFGQKVFIQSILPYYRPMLLVSFIFDAHIGGLDPVVYHAHNIVIHLAASCLVFFFLVKFGAAKAWSFFCGLLFAVHPALVQAVAWLPGRNDSMVTVFCLASFILFLGFIGSRKVWEYALHMLFFALALFTKESAVVLPFLTTFYLLLIQRGRFFTPDRIALWCGYALIGAGWFLCRQAAVAGSLEMSLYDMLRFAAVYLPAVIQLFGKAIFPVGLSVFPTMQNTPYLYGYVALAVIVLLLSLSRAKRYPVIVFGVAWFLCFLVPSLTRPHAGVINDVLEHRLYLPIIGLFIILSEVTIPERLKRLARIIGVVVLVIFACVAVRHSDDYRNEFSFWENAVAASPDSPYARLLLGTVYYDDDLVEKAEREITAALALDNQLLRAHYFLGMTYMKKMMYRKAALEFKKEIALYPGFDAPYSALAVAYYRSGKGGRLDLLWRKALEINPDSIEAYRNLAMYYAETGNPDGARECVEELERRGVPVPADFVRSIGQE